MAKGHMKAEMAALKKGGASSKLIKSEKAEYMANGGMAGRAMPAQSNAGGAMRGQARAAAMSGRVFADGGKISGAAGGAKDARKGAAFMGGKAKGKPFSA